MTDNTEYDYDKLGEEKIEEALIAFEKRHRYSLKTKEQSKIHGGDYLTYNNYSLCDDNVYLNYHEHTPHDCPYSIELVLPKSNPNYPKLEYNKEETYTKEDMVGFAEWLITKSFREGTSDYTTEELFDIWQKQKYKQY